EEEGQALLDDLTAALNAAVPAPGSVEALLLDWAGRANPEGRWWGPFYRAQPGDAKEPARQIALRGFEAIPGLIALLDDRRITAHERPAFGRQLPHIHRLGEIAEQLLREMVAEQAPPTADDKPRSAAWRAWWEQSRGRREADFFAVAVFAVKDGRIT